MYIYIIYVYIYIYILGAGHRVSRRRGTGSVGVSVGEGSRQRREARCGTTSGVAQQLLAGRCITSMRTALQIDARRGQVERTGPEWRICQLLDLVAFLCTLLSTGPPPQPAQDGRVIVVVGHLCRHALPRVRRAALQVSGMYRHVCLPCVPAMCQDHGMCHHGAACAMP